MTVTFPLHLRQYQESTRLSWRQIAEKTGVNVNTLIRIKDGYTKQPEPATILQICRRLGWSEQRAWDWIAEYADDDLRDALDHT